MLKFSGFHFKKPALLTVAILGLAFLSIEASAQTEQEKTEENLPRPIEKVVVEDQPAAQDNVPTTFLPARSTQNFKTAPVKKENAVIGVAPEKETKKHESPSTLSFNIFLYVVDKFKAD